MPIVTTETSASLLHKLALDQQGYSVGLLRGIAETVNKEAICSKPQFEGQKEQILLSPKVLKQGFPAFFDLIQLAKKKSFEHEHPFYFMEFIYSYAPCSDTSPTAAYVYCITHFII